MDPRAFARLSIWSFHRLEFVTVEIVDQRGCGKFVGVFDANAEEAAFLSVDEMTIDDIGPFPIGKRSFRPAFRNCCVLVPVTTFSLRRADLRVADLPQDPASRKGFFEDHPRVVSAVLQFADAGPAITHKAVVIDGRAFAAEILK